MPNYEYAGVKGIRYEHAIVEDSVGPASPQEDVYHEMNTSTAALGTSGRDMERIILEGNEGMTFTQ
jgi:hypothetical protein